MKNERYHSFRPGEVILQSNEPVAVKYREELMSYLDEYPEGRDKNDLKGRFWSYTENGFHSACFELFLHHFLHTRCLAIEPHPSLPGVTSHPDFALEHISGNFFFEATLALDSDEHLAQEARLRELVDAVHKVKSNLVLWAQPVTHLPDGFPLDCVRDFLQNEVDKLNHAAPQLPQSLRFEDNFNGSRVVIDFAIIGANQDSYDSLVQAWGSPDVREVTTHKRIRRVVGIKATKYGQMDKPYVIAVWPKCQFPLTEEVALRALYGDRCYRLYKKPHQIEEINRRNNGVFNTPVNDDVLNRQVSAVALYREEFSMESYERRLCVYHNPYPLNPLSKEVFSGLPQFIFQIDNNGSGHMQWSSDTSTWDE